MSSGTKVKEFPSVSTEKSHAASSDEPTVLHVIKVQKIVEKSAKSDEEAPKYICEKCGVQQTSKSALLLHLQEHWISCEVCGDKFSDFAQYSDHWGQIHAPSSEIPTEVKTHEDLWQMLQEEASFSLFNREEEPSRNLTWVSVGNNNPMCRKCNIQFSSKRALNLHYLTHGQDRPILCKTCGESFVRVEDFIESCSRHCRMRQLSNKGYPTRPRSLSRPQLLFKCKQCPKAFCNQGNLNRHELIHGGIRNYLCDICHEAFTERIALQKHYLIHAEIKPYVCELCEKTFSSKPALTAHRQAHDDEKMMTHTCYICGVDIIGKRNFKRHSLEHLPGQVCSCDICGKAFATKKKLQLHVMIHSDDSTKPFKCSVCDRGFTYGSHLKRHMLSHTGERPFACGICGETFLAKYSLTYHLNKHRKEREA